MSYEICELEQEERDTQLHTIRDLMLAAGRRGAWLTLGEIAGVTEIGEASISAQLRHLRKRQYGRHLVEKRRRVVHGAAAAHGDGQACDPGEPVRWEYRVLAPASD